jgi:predicted ATPase
MWLEELQLTDFRGFRHLKLDLRRQLTVVIGVNGAGKSSLVRAIEIGASHAAQAAFNDVSALSLTKQDVRIGQSNCAIELGFGGRQLRVSRTVGGKVQREPRSLSEGVWPPLCILFGSDRAVLPRHGQPSSTDPRNEHPPWDMVSDYTSFELGELWFRHREDLENQERVRSKRLDYVDRGLGHARAAIARMLPRYSDLHIDRSRPLGSTSQLVLSKDGQELTADILSEGERSLLVLAMTIARRLSLLDPTIATSSHAAVVVIDEVELHLHPKWQRTVIPSLLQAFPNCQLIVTTHSPQVIGSVPRESIVVLDDFALYDAAAPTEGRDSNAILEEIMDVPERSEAAGAELDDIARLLDHDELESARVAIDRLATRWGEDDREVVRLRTALHFRDLYDADDSQGQ